MVAAVEEAMTDKKMSSIRCLEDEFTQKLLLKHKYELFAKIKGRKPINTQFSPSMETTGDQICSQANQRLHVKETVMSSNQYIAYFRVSTIRQGASGLGLDAQRAATAQFVHSAEGTLLHEYTEVESGKTNNRLNLDAAIEKCRKTGATLLIAKLDRLARNVAFTANLLESGVKFIAVDMPNADRFMLHVYAAMAEEEGRRISERTKAALASAKARGVELGKNGKVLAQRNKAKAQAFAFGIENILRSLIETEKVSFRTAAERMNDLGIPSPRGAKWHSTSVHRAWIRISS